MIDLTKLGAVLPVSENDERIVDALVRDRGGQGASSPIPPSPPAPLSERPRSAPCPECGELVEPIRLRAGWYPLERHRECRLLHEARVSALEAGDEAARALCSGGLSRYAGLSLQRTVPLQAGSPARQRDQAAQAGELIEHRSNRAAISALRAWEPGQTIVIEGPVGTGKTAALLAWCQDQLRTLVEGPRMAGGAWRMPRHIQVRYFTAEALAGELLRRTRERRQDDPIEWALAGDALVLDDVGAERLSGWQREQWEGWLAAIVDRAYTRARALVVGTNLTQDGLIERYPVPGERMVSRLRGMAGPRWIEVGGVNWREAT